LSRSASPDYGAKRIFWGETALPNSNADAVDAFIQVFVSGKNSAGKIADLIGLFCKDDAKTPTIPTVGITDHGPNFTGVDDITDLFTQIFTSFPNILLQYASFPNAPKNYPPLLYSDDKYTPPTIAVQTTLVTGPYVADWFKHPSGGSKKKDHFSPPLSNISHIPGKPASTTIPVAAVFSFVGDKSYKISQLSLYLDRWRFQADLQKGSTVLLAGYNHSLHQLAEFLTEKN
jgi:hypothetical protein